MGGWWGKCHELRCHHYYRLKVRTVKGRDICIHFYGIPIIKSSKFKHIPIYIYIFLFMRCSGLVTIQLATARISNRSKTPGSYLSQVRDEFRLRVSCPKMSNVSQLVVKISSTKKV